MIRRLLLSYLSITALVLLLLEVPLGFVFARRERSALISAVRRDADSIATYASGPLTSGDRSRLQAVASAYRSQTGGRVVVVDSSGTALADSDDPGADRSFASRPELGRALAGEDAHGFRYSRTLDQRLLFVAVPVDPGGRVVGAVRVTYPSSVVDARIRRTWLVLGGLGLLVLGVVALVSLVLARSIARPLRAIEDAAGRLGEGDLSARAPVPDHPPELRRLAQQVNDAGSRLERLVSSQQDFVADASHQLRTPLAALRLRLEILEGEVPPRTAEDVSGALAEVHRLSRLIDGLLVLARAEQVEQRPVPASLRAVVEERRAAWGSLADERGVGLDVDVAPTLGVLVTPGHLEQVLDNLLANALEVSPSGSRISITAVEEDRWVAVHIVDEGPGMGPEQRAHAFDRFWRPATARAGGGFGLGLAIARRLVVNDGGQLDLFEAATGGLDARVRLQRAGTVPGWSPPLVSRPG